MLSSYVPKSKFGKDSYREAWGLGFGLGKKAYFRGINKSSGVCRLYDRKSCLEPAEITCSEKGKSNLLSRIIYLRPSFIYLYIQTTYLLYLQLITVTLFIHLHLSVKKKTQEVMV